MLWSGLADYNPTEQAYLIKELSKHLAPNGSLIIDTMPMNVQPLNTEVIGNQSFLTRSKNNNVVCTYEPTSDEICKYAENVKLKVLNKITCFTDTQRVRWLYILRK